MRKLKLFALFAAMLFATSMWATDPMGSVDGAVGKNGSLYVNGWALDPDDGSKTVEVHVYIFSSSTENDLGKAVKGIPGTYANLERPDLKGNWGTSVGELYGTKHGFDRTIDISDLSAGTYYVQIYALNVAGSGTNPRLTYSNNGGYKKQITLSAPFTVSYNANGGSGAPGSQKKCSDITLKLSTTTPTRTGYTFNGWNTNNSGTGTNYAAGANYTANASVTLYAKWNLVNYSISYTLNGGSVTGNPTSYNVTTNTFTLKNPTRTGYTFAGWTGSNGNTPQTSVSVAKGSTGNKTYTANWTLNTYTITYNLNGGNVSPANPASYNVTTNTFTLNNPTKAGYTFTGWTGSNGNTPQTSVSVAKGSTGNKTYTANWAPVNYTITYNLDGGNATNPANYNIETATFTLNNPTKEHNDFLGWTGSNGSTPQTTVTINNGSTGDKTYTANWLLHTFAVETDESMASDWSVTASPVGVGQTVTATYTGTKHVKSVSYLGVPVVIAPTAKLGLIYTGAAQELVNAGSSTGGTMQYKVNEGEWSDAVPSATNAGTYTVYYRVQGSETYAGHEGGSFNVTIAKATPAAVTLSKTSISFGADDFTTTFTVTRTGDGAISVSSSNSEVKCTVSGNTVTVRRRSGRPLSNITITVSVAASANYLAPANKTCSYSHSALRTPANIQAKDKGCFLGAYGYLWPKDYATDIVEPLRAVVAYVGSCDKYFDKCLCIALEDISGTRLSRADAATAVNTWASSHGVNVGGTVYSGDAGGYYDFASPYNYKIRDWAVAKGWRLPTVCDWRYIMNAYKGSSLTNPAGVNHGANPNLCKWSELRTAINSATGGTAMKTDNNYGSSTRDNGNSNMGTWHVGTGDGGWATWWWANDHDGYKYYYRAVFAY